MIARRSPSRALNWPKTSAGSIPRRRSLSSTRARLLRTKFRSSMETNSLSEVGRRAHLTALQQAQWNQERDEYSDPAEGPSGLGALGDRLYTTDAMYTFLPRAMAS